MGLELAKSFEDGHLIIDYSGAYDRREMIAITKLGNR
jgi:hypothetical protein